MRPLLLILHGIGPYGGRQIVDFRGVIDAGLFGIYGATGSGKSTIFSALTFALFGEAARSEQHVTTLRSDYADPQTLSQVELVFEAGARTYRIVRQPEQTRPAKRGGGDVKEAHKAWLFEVTGLRVDDVGPNNPGRVIAETKVKQVDDAVKGILGYGAAQFRQIVLLPQGRFEAFLAASTDERKAILRDLFDVSLYRRLAEHLKAEADAAEKAVIQSRAIAQARLGAEGYDNFDALSEGIADAELSHRDLAEAEGRAKGEWQAVTTAWDAAVAADAAFREFQTAEAECSALAERQAAIDDVASRLRQARLAQSLLDVAEARETARRDVVAAEVRLAEAQERLKSSQSVSLRAKDAMAGLLQQADAIEQKKAQLILHQGYAKRLQASVGLSASAREAEGAARQAVERAKALRCKVETLGFERERASRHLHDAYEKQEERSHLRVALTEARQRHASARDFERALAKKAEAEAALDQVQRQLHDIEVARAAAEADAVAEEARLLKDHALHLALHLKDGEPCPVCGSAEHPAPAHGSAAVPGLDVPIIRAKSRRDQARKTAEDARVRFEAARQAHEDRVSELQRLSAPSSAASAAEQDILALESKVRALGDEVEAGSLTDALGKLDGQLKDAQQSYEAARENVSQTERKAVAARQNYDSALADIPADLHAHASLAAAIASLIDAVSDYERKVKAAAAADLAAAEDLAASRQKLETAAAELERLRQRLSSEEKRFAARLAESGLDAQSFVAHQQDIASISDFEAVLSRHCEQRVAAETRRERARAPVANLDRPDLVAKAAMRNEAAAALDRAKEVTVKAAVRLENLQKLKSDLEREIWRLDQQEKEMAPLKELAEAFAGRSYHQVDLETFAISALFDQVLDAANLRLGPMTRQRYSLMRDIGGSGRARRGLGIVVEDAYTGRQRPTSTLSGGETFIAALALALGLSDVVESAHGSVRLDTIFIDEGFGSLDSESDGGTLETVMQTLQDMVGANRAVGLISHVPLVQQVVPNGFFVTKMPAGSRIEVRG